MKTLKVPSQGKTMKKFFKNTTKKKWPPKKPVNDHDADDMPMKKRKISSRPIKGAVKPMKKKKATGSIKHSGSFHGKSNQLGQGGRAAQMRARGVPGGVIGAIARREGAAPGQANYHKHKTLKIVKKSSKTKK